MNASEYWAMHPWADAIQIVAAGFGELYLGEVEWATRRHNHHVRLVLLDEGNVAGYEPSIRKELDRICWQMIVVSLLDNTRYKSMWHPSTPPTPPAYRTDSNRYGVAPIGEIWPRPTRVYHATPNWKAEQIRQDGLKPNTSVCEYPDTEGKIHVCAKLNGDDESAANWARLLSKQNELAEDDYTILEFDLGHVPLARIHQDLHSRSGIVVDNVSIVPAKAITKTFSFSNGSWVERGNANRHD